ncbi:hypothetical protein HMPREF7545_1837 [Selenomonas noxia ATCC 43541]|uniref:hypothetical protein n=1 Tax=Selenomonas noxia TaxID=135083 RepID=UPI0001BCC85F|nr:hypothetical protein [Selenomonas noxia]EFF65466.1 hypothetical protein HMPREF7545_1837 [Selenomonas noxia ATCC 43541]
MTEAVQNRGDQGDSSAAFSQRTNVSIETAIDHMADILSKINGRQQTNVQQMPQELKELIQNMIRQSFSLETTLGQGLGSTAASQRFSTDQLTTLARILNQLGAMAETDSSGIPRVGDDLAALLTGLKTALIKEAGGTFEPIMLTKAAFQLLDTGNAEFLPKDLQTSLSQLNAQGSASASLSGNAGTTSLSFLNQLVQLLMPHDAASTAQSMPTNGSMQEGTPQTAPQNLIGEQEGRASSTVQNTNTAVPEENLLEQPPNATRTNALAKENTTAARQAEKAPSAPTPSNTSSAQGTNETGTAQKAMMGDIPSGTNVPGREQNSATPTENTQIPAQSGKEAAPMPRQGDPQTSMENKTPPEGEAQTVSRSETQTVKANLQEETAAQPARPQSEREAELKNAAKVPTQSAAQMKSAEIQGTIPRFFTQMMENTPQTMNVLRNLAQSLLQNDNLSQRETRLLQNFVNGRSQTLSDGDAKQLQKLIHLTQQNIPGTVRQAALEQQMPDLPRLWAFMQMADIVKTRKMTAEQYKRAGRDVAALALTMRNALEGENAAPQPGQRSMNFIMPLFMGASEYPAYIHVYDESHTDEDTGNHRKETWLRICVLTDNIGTVELINRIYEENHVDMRLYFSDADAAWEFRNALDTIRETADGTSFIIEGIQIGAIGERRFFTN